MWRIVGLPDETGKVFTKEDARPILDEIESQKKIEIACRELAKAKIVPEAKRLPTGRIVLCTRVGTDDEIIAEFDAKSDRAWSYLDLINNACGRLVVYPDLLS